MSGFNKCPRCCDGIVNNYGVCPQCFDELVRHASMVLKTNEERDRENAERFAKAVEAEKQKEFDRYNGREKERTRTGRKLDSKAKHKRQRKARKANRK